MPSNCTLWIQDGALVVDDNGAPILSEDCPCGDCCGRVAKEIVKLLNQTTRYCVPCDQGTWTEGCGDCEVVIDEQEGISQLGQWATRRRNPVQSFDEGCSGFHIITPEPAGGYVEGQDIQIQICDETATVPYSTQDPYPSMPDSETPGAVMVKLFCVNAMGSEDRLYPVIYAPDSPDIFGTGSNRCQQKYWRSCFDPNPQAFIKCGVQVIAPRSWFDDAPQSVEPDMTMVWGVLGCFCEGNDKWKIRRLCGGEGNGYIVVNAPFIPDKVNKLDPEGNPIPDGQGGYVEVMKCEANCECLKETVREMMNHYQTSLKAPKTAVRATINPQDWQTWTGETPAQAACFWGYILLPTVYGYVCQHTNSQSVMTQYVHWLVFDCDCALSDIETDYSGGGLTLPSEGIYEVEGDHDICEDCPPLWALMAFARGEGWSMSQSGTSDPRDTGDGGVILTEDSRDLGGGIYVIGGPATMFAAWNESANMLVWIDCDCGLHVECVTNWNKRFLYYKDACTCLDWREIVDDNAALFGVTQKNWGSHTIVEWTHSTASQSYEGPYWLYNTNSSDSGLRSVYCEQCEPHTHNATYMAYFNVFIDWNMLVVHRVVAGNHEIGHVQKEGGIVNFRLNQAGAQMSGITAGSVSTDYPELCGDPHADGCPGGTFAGYYILPNYFNLYATHGGSVECPCDPEPWDLPICLDHSRKLSVDTVFAEAPTELYNHMGCISLNWTPTKFTEPGYEAVRCDGVCIWEPGKDSWALFSASYVRTSCGLLIVQSDGHHFYIPSFTVPGYAGSLVTQAKAAIVRQYGWVDETYVYGAYPSTDTVISGTSPNIAQPPLCHKTQCGGYTQYDSFSDYCDNTTADPISPSSECKCYKKPSDTDCTFLN